MVHTDLNKLGISILLYSFKGPIKSHHMFILSYVTFYLLLHSAVLISEFIFSFYLPGQPHVQNHVSRKEIWYENLLPELKSALKKNCRN